MTAPDGSRKIPELTAAFWVAKVAATTLGETAGDLVSMTLGVGYAASSAILLSFFAVTVALQLRAKAYLPPLYWSVILATSTAGTTISDYLDRTAHLGYALGSGLLFATLLVIFAIWKASGEPFAVDRIRSGRVEFLYWSAILVSNTLGTAVGDFLADDSGLGFAGGALAIGTLLTVLLFAHFQSTFSKVAMFWAAFVLTRPFGAAMGDVLTKPPARGGIGFGTVGASAALSAVLVFMVVREVRARRRILAPA